MRESDERAALVHHDPAALDRVFNPGEILFDRSLNFEQKRPVDLLDMNAAILNGFDAVGDVDQLAGCCFGV